jgi:hypothetical protein
MASTCILVLGMHRSGTSALTRCLNLLGMDLGSNLIAPEAMNSKGFWEHADAVRINNDLLQSFDMYWRSLGPLPENWLASDAAARAREQIALLIERDFSGIPLWGIKDPRICRLAPLWLDVLRELGVTAKVVITVRSPLEVAASIGKAHPELSDMQLNVFSWMQHVAESEAATRGVARTMVEYDSLMSDPDRVLADIGASLDIQWPMPFADRSQIIHAFLDVGLRTHRSGDAAESEPAMARRLINACKVVARNSGRGEWNQLSEVVDEVIDTTRFVGVLERMRGETVNQSLARAVLYVAASGHSFDEASAMFRNVPYGRSRFEFWLPGGSAANLRFRLDPIDRHGCCLLRSMVLMDGGGQVMWDFKQSTGNLELAGMRHVPSFVEEGRDLLITSDDPQILFQLPESLVLDGTRLQIDIERLSNVELCAELDAADALRSAQLQATEGYLARIDEWQREAAAGSRQAQEMEASLHSVQAQLQALQEDVAQWREASASVEKVHSMELSLHDIQAQLKLQDAKMRDLENGESGLKQQTRALAEEVHMRRHWLWQLLRISKN